MICVPLLISLLAISPADDSTTNKIMQSLVTPVNKTVLLQLVNNARKKGGTCGNTYFDPAPPVSWNTVLEKAAFSHSNDMSVRKYFSHTSPDGTGAGERINDAGYAWKTYGENIAMGYRSETEVMEGWLKSPGHCKNIMNKNFKEVAVAHDGDYWTQEFGAK